MTTTERRRRQYGTGSVYQRADGKWIGRYEVGRQHLDRRPAPASVVGKTEAEAKRLLRDKIRALDDGVATTTRTNVKAWSATWSR